MITGRELSETDDRSRIWEKEYRGLVLIFKRSVFSGMAAIALISSYIVLSQCRTGCCFMDEAVVQSNHLKILESFSITGSETCG